jgi:anaerobic ribonucleoside-triphosphate reductase activating protein
MALIKISGTVDDSVVDGEGYRFTIFTQGCPHCCEGCHNPQTHDFNGGKVADTDIIFREICENPLLSGVTFSGGEPFCQPIPLAALGQKLHEKGLNVWTFTGYTLEELQEMQRPDIEALLAEIDVLVDGRFVLKERDLTLSFCGSRNQRIIDMKATRTADHIVLKMLG